MQKEVELVEKMAFLSLSYGVWSLVHLQRREFHSYLTGSLHNSKTNISLSSHRKKIKKTKVMQLTIARKKLDCVYFVSHNLILFNPSTVS